MPDRFPMPSRPRSLTIRALETIPIRVPLARTYRGSQYQMTHRSTIICRVHTDEGVVGEAYAGDEDAALGAIVERSSTTRSRRGWSARTPSPSSAAGSSARPATFDILRDRRLGLVALRLRRTRRSGTRSARRSASRSGGCGAAIATELPMISIGGYYGATTPTSRTRSPSYRELGLGGLKFKVGGVTPDEDADAFRRARAAAGDDFVLLVDANQGWSPTEAIELRPARRGRRPPLVRGAVPLGQRPPRACATCATPPGVAVCAGQSEYSAAGCRDLMAAGAIDVCNFDASWSGGPTEWRRAAAVAHELRRRDGPSRGAAGRARICSRRSRTGRTSSASTPTATRSGGTSSRTGPPLVDGRMRLPDGPGLGWELDDVTTSIATGLDA